MNKKTFFSAVSLAAISAAVIFLYRCPIRLITGFPCPGCGITRAFIMSFYDVRGAFFMHPLFPFVGISCAALCIKPARLYIKNNITHIYQMLIFLFAAIYIWRMLIVFPDTPMEYYEKNLFSRLSGRAGVFLIKGENYYAELS